MASTMDGLTAEQRDVIALVRDFVEREIIPVAHHLEYDDTYPEAIVAKMKELGFFGFAIDERWGGAGLNMETYARVCEEIARGWMSITGVINTHFIVAFLLQQFGTDEQRQRFLPKMATGEYHAAFSMSEPNCGSDVQAIRTRAVRDNGEYVIDGTKMWVTNGERSTVVATLVKTDPSAKPRGWPASSPRRGTRASAPASTSTSSATRAWRPPSWSSTATGSRRPTSSAGSRVAASSR
jgi:alkylation response protein AidB-like acyl-CoA dehydrogenase